MSTSMSTYVTLRPQACVQNASTYGAVCSVNVTQAHGYIPSQYQIILLTSANDGGTSTQMTIINNNNNNNHFISIAVKPLRRTASTHHIYRTSVGTQARTTGHKQQGLARA